jgi:molybdate transport system substrate-binding protein
MGDPDVPIGAYTREVLDRLPAPESKAIFDNVASNEPDVAGIVGKLTQGAVGAGFVYASDVTAADGALAAVELPKSLQPDVGYAVAVVKGSDHAEAAQRFVDGLTSADGQRVLRENGFLPPP